MEGHLQRPTLEIRGDGFNQVGREVEDSEPVKAFDPYGVQGFCAG